VYEVNKRGKLIGLIDMEKVVGVHAEESKLNITVKYVTAEHLR
jgi:chemotaxis signal transduction protein